MLDLQKKLVVTKNPLITCPIHNDPLKVYCETCCQVICRDCAISKEHKSHNWHLISECFDKNRQQIETNLETIKNKMADLNTAVTQIDTTEREVIEKEKQLQEQINTHAQQIIDQAQRSSEQLSQQLHNIAKQKTQLLAAQKQLAQQLHTQLSTCHETIERNLKEWTQLQILTEKHTMINQMNTTTRHVDPTVFQPIEKANMQLTKTDLTINGIGLITSTTYGNATLEVSPCSAKQPTTATLTLHSQDGSPFSLPPSLISSTLSSPGDTHSVKCEITQTRQPAKYNITFTQSTRLDQLIVQVGGVDISDGPFNLPVIPEMRGKPVNIITGLNNPWGIAVSDKGDIVVAEYGAHCITTLNMEGKKVKSFGTKGQFTCPRGVAITNDGHLLVTDKHRLQKLTTDGVFVKSVGSSESGSGQLQLNTPTGITVHPITGQIFVADTWNNRIQVFNIDLTFSHTITPSGNKRFYYPYDVALDNNGYLYIAEFWNSCITKLTTKGKNVTRFGSTLYRPTSLTINNDLVYVTESGNNRVSIFETNGTFLHRFGKKGSGEGEFKGPQGITIDTLSNLYVSETDNNRIAVC